MSQLLSVSINVSKINKARLVKGEKGQYLNLTLSIGDADQFGNNVQVWEGQTKEERAAKTDNNFLGNGRVIYTGDQQAQANQSSAAQNASDDLPF